MNDLLMHTHIKDKGQWEADPPHPKKSPKWPILMADMDVSTMKFGGSLCLKTPKHILHHANSDLRKKSDSSSKVNGFCYASGIPGPLFSQ